MLVHNLQIFRNWDCKQLYAAIEVNHSLSWKWLIWLWHGLPINISSFGLPLLLLGGRNLQIGLLFIQLPFRTEVGSSVSETWSMCSVISNSLRLHGLQPARLPYPWNFSGEHTEVGCHFLFQGIFPTLEIQSLSLLHLLHWQADSLL